MIIWVYKGDSNTDTMGCLLPLSDHGGDGGVLVSKINPTNRPDMATACIDSDESRGSEVTFIWVPFPAVIVASLVDFIFFF